MAELYSWLKDLISNDYDVGYKKFISLTSIYFDHDQFNTHPKILYFDLYALHYCDVFKVF